MRIKAEGGGRGRAQATRLGLLFEPIVFRPTPLGSLFNADQFMLINVYLKITLNIVPF